MADRALLVDFGGVLTTSVFESFLAFCDDEGIDRELFKSVVLAAAREPGSPFARVETGAISQEDFDTQLAAILGEACGRPIEPAGLKARLFARALPEAAMHDVVRAVRASGIPTVLVSNSWGGDDYPMAELGRLFDHVVISGHVGMRKPEPDIYLYAARVAQASPGSCVFVDDLRVNVEGAERVGMTGILHREVARTIALLGEHLALELPGVAG